VALRDALESREASGQTCFVVAAEAGPVSIAGQPIRAATQLKTREMQNAFDAELKVMLDDFKVGGVNVADGIIPLKAGETYATHIPQLKAIYFRNKGVLVSVWSSKKHETTFFPGHSVFVKILRVAPTCLAVRPSE
jgi:hypothetical protein